MDHFLLGNNQRAMTLNGFPPQIQRVDFKINWFYKVFYLVVFKYNKV